MTSSLPRKFKSMVSIRIPPRFRLEDLLPEKRTIAIHPISPANRVRYPSFLGKESESPEK